MAEKEDAMSDEYDDLAKRVSALEAEQAEMKKAIEALKPPDPFKRKFQMPHFDPTEQFRLPADAAQAMARVVPDVKGKGFNEHAWSQTRMYGPGGFGPSPERMRAAEEETRRKERAEAEEAKRRAEAKAKAEAGTIEGQLAAAGWRRKPI